MKKFLLVAAASSLFMVSCNNEIDNVFPSEENGLQTRSLVRDADFQVVNYNGENCIQFKNDSVFEALSQKMMGMSETEITSMFFNVGFKSQLQLMAEADKEQEMIVDNYEKDLDQQFPSEQIQAFKQKYEDVFLFNPYDSTDFVANYKTTTFYRYFANENSLFLIGDSLVKAPEYTIEECFGNGIMVVGKNEHTPKDSKNKAESKFQIINGDYVKVRAIPKIIRNEGDNYKQVGFDYLSQKKKKLWKKHHGRIHLRLKAYGSGTGFEVWHQDTVSPVVTGHFENKDNQQLMIYANVYDKSNADEAGHAFGRIGRANVKPYFFWKGNMEIWSDEIPETERGYSKIDLSED